MADLIDRLAFMKAMYHRAFETDGDTMWQSGCWVRYKAIEQVVKEQPSIDAVEVVRCKDCKHRDVEDGFCEGRGWPMQLVPDDGFCDKGERSE